MLPGKTSYLCIDICNNNPLISGQCLRCWFSAIQTQMCEIIISETVPCSLCRQQRFCSWISLFNRSDLLAGCSVQGHQDSGSCSLNLAPICQNLATFSWKTSVWEFSCRELIFLLTDERATWIPMGLVILMLMRFYFITYICQKKKSGKPVGQSFVTGTASKAGLNVVEVG